MTETDFNPYVRYIAKIREARPYPERICAYDHRLFFVEEGAFCVEFEDSILPLSAGDLITIPPAIPYRLLFSAPEKLQYYVINFDFDSSAFGTEAHTPQPADKFDPSEIFSTADMAPFDTVFLQHNAESLASVFSELYNESLKRRPSGRNDRLPEGTYSAFLISALLKYLLTRIACSGSSDALPPSSPSAQLILTVKDYIKKNVCSAVTNNSVAEHFDYHPYYLNSLFVKQEGITLHKYIVGIKLGKAKELLTSTNQAIYAIAAECGFQSASYFSEMFLKYEKMTPTQYRELGK